MADGSVINPSFWVNIIQTLGFPIVAAGYFAFKDYRFTSRIAVAMEKIAENLAVIKDRLGEETRDA